MQKKNNHHEFVYEMASSELDKKRLRLLEPKISYNSYSLCCAHHFGLLHYHFSSKVFINTCDEQEISGFSYLIATKLISLCSAVAGRSE